MADETTMGSELEVSPDKSAETAPVEVGPKVLSVLVLGAGGMLGREVTDELVSRGHSVRSPFHTDFDITNSENIDKIRKEKVGPFDWIVNCAAYTQVDLAESEKMAAMKVNAVAPGMLGVAAKESGARVLHVSTDFVFDGRAEAPYREDSPTAPLGTYGMSKLMGEENLLKELSDAVVVRTSWLFGPYGRSFPRTMVEAIRNGKELRVVGDQTGKPTYTKDLAGVIADMIERPVPGGVYHAAGPDVATWWGFAMMAVMTDLARQGKDPKVAREKITKVTTAEYPTPAKRPAFSVLDCSKLEALRIGPMRHLNDVLPEFLARLELASR